MKITVDEILKSNHFKSLETLKQVHNRDGFDGTEYDRLKQAMKEFAEKVLELAAENAELKNTAGLWLEPRMTINKESITSVINQIEF
jgi:hypothetical protein